MYAASTSSASVLKALSTGWIPELRSASVRTTTLSPKAAAISSRVFRLVSLLKVLV